MHPCSWRGHQGTLIAATGGPLLGSTRDLQSRGVLGGKCLGLPPHPMFRSTCGRHCRGSILLGTLLLGKLADHLGSLRGTHPLCWRCQLGSGHRAWLFPGWSRRTRTLAAPRISSTRSCTPTIRWWYLGRGNMDLIRGGVLNVFRVN